MTIRVSITTSNQGGAGRIDYPFTYLISVGNSSDVSSAIAIHDTLFIQAKTQDRTTLAVLLVTNHIKKTLTAVHSIETPENKRYICGFKLQTGHDHTETGFDHGKSWHINSRAL